MKKLRLLLTAFMALVMLATSALAEPTAAQIIRLSNPTVTMDGITVSGLDDLALQLALCESADRSVMQLIFDLFIGGENASSAMLQLEDTTAVMLLGGMSSAYSVSYDDLEALMGSGSAFADILSMAETWTLPDDLVSVLETHSGDLLVNNPEVITNSDGVVMQSYYFTGDITDCIIDVMRLIENDEFIGALLNALEPDASLEGLADELAESGLGFGLSGTYSHDNFGYITELDLTVSIYENGELIGSVDGVYNINIDENDVSNISYDCCFVQKDAQGNPIADTSFIMTMTENSFTLNGAENYKNGETANFNFVWVDSDNILICTAETVDAYGDESTFSLVGQLTETANGWSLNTTLTSEESGDAMSIVLRADYSANGGAESLTVSMNVSDTYSTASIEIELGCDIYDGVYYGTLTMNDGYDESSIALRIDPVETAAGADYSGVISLTVNDGVDDILMTADLTVLSTTVDTDNFYVDPASAVDLLTISDVQTDTANAELEAIMNSILLRLEEAYPAFFGGITEAY